ncbi:isoleucine--tRNA ligase [Phormidium yuhuli AB48]|uniref:Isoleucine--tRNA ligase n=1 Tax=Phormidium yuhuli AB48 TaxID=2940671 RepID=A0ABY5AKQ7_9CYAN|nr:isoleucine--tRNA ligase [Phormidium yuhuli]USR89513.1 isoleucine--tRNA ligase [Phormidium yuhuli AB48]
MTEEKRYKETVNLPQTGFSMRANAVVREPELQAFWEDRKIYQNVAQNNPGDPFILHDGPPYANGSLHIGHALNKILKDIINRYQLLQGRKVRYIPGWDCHGLPIELKVLQSLKPEERRQLTPLALRFKAKEFAHQVVREQRESFKRYGVWGDWDDPYLTLNPEYEAAQIGVFGEMALKGYIYRGRKPVHWSPSSRTALAEAELEYPEGHTSPSLYAAFQVTELNDGLKERLADYLPHLWLAIWTTTPWTIPANLAVSVNPELTYAIVEAPVEFEAAAGKFLIVAADAVERLSQTFGGELRVLERLKGTELDQCHYRHPLFERTSPVVIGGDYVTTESGTGLVHTAPGHGLEDYQVGLRYNLPIFSPVNAKGILTKDAGPFAGLNVLKDANEKISEALAEAHSLLKQEPYQHKYPYDWRTKKPTIFRATEQWFASVEGFREAALASIGQVRWIPTQGENRITAMVGERSDWCISRQRSWGVPIPVFYDEETNEPLLKEETVNYVRDIVAEKGSDAWWELPVEQLLPESYRNNGRTYVKGTDTMDVWFDSGSSWAAVAKQRGLGYPVDLYLEGSDQHRGWFQSSLLTSVATQGQAPYKTVLTHGFVLDEKGHKMSKSLGNVVDPAVVINGGNNQKQQPPYGADVLRLWVSSVDYSGDVPLGGTILRQTSDVYRKIRNTARFLLGNLHDFNPATDAVAYEELPELDQYMLHRTIEVMDEVTEAFESYQFFRFFQTIQNFCVVDLSNFYLDIAKDRLYISAEDASRRRSCQTVLAIVVENLARAIAPVLCHMAEDIWQNLPYETDCESVFEAGWVQLEEDWRHPELAQRWETLRFYRAEVNKVMEKARADKKIGSSLDAKLKLFVADEAQRDKLAGMNPELAVAASTATAVADAPEEAPVAASDEVETESPEPIHPETPGKTAGVAASEPNSLERSRPSGLALPQWENLKVRDVMDFIVDAPGYLVDVYRTNRLAIRNLALLLALVMVAYLSSSLLAAVNRLLFLPEFFTAIGFGYSLRFGYRNVLYASDRQKLVGRANDLKLKVLGTDVELPPNAVQQVADKPAIAPEPEPAAAPELPAAAEEESTAPVTHSSPGNGVDELRYLFICSQVELLDSPEALDGIAYASQSEGLGIGIVSADGDKCERCWNYSTHVGDSQEHPSICERCVSALAGQF